jgi:hypothetical protein
MWTSEVFAAHCVVTGLCFPLDWALSQSDSVAAKWC